MSLLDIAGVSIAFGGVRAVRDVSFAVEEGEIVGLIGPNGAGKTTLLRLLFGLARPDSGRIRFAGHEIAALPTHRRARLGIGFTHQIVRPFRDMSLLDNVVVAAAPEVTRSPVRALFRRDARQAVERARALLARLDIADAADRPARTVPLGYLKRLQVARALALSPRFLMLDEPLAGLNHSEAARLADLIVALNRDGVTVLIVEHNIAEVTRISRRLVVLHNGSVLADGLPGEVMQRRDVRDAYLGTHA